MVEKKKILLKVYKKELFWNSKHQVSRVCKINTKLYNICKKCFCFIYPSCAEGTATAALTALSVGFYPISEDTRFNASLKVAGSTWRIVRLRRLRKNQQSFLSQRDEVQRQIRETQKYVTTTYKKKISPKHSPKFSKTQDYKGLYRKMEKNFSKKILFITGFIS